MDKESNKANKKARTQKVSQFGRPQLQRKQEDNLLGSIAVLPTSLGGVQEPATGHCLTQRVQG